MKHLFYDDFRDKRLDKILNIFLKDWFFRKKILEMGAGDGDIGIKLLKLGSDVTFSDVRQQHLDTINKKLIELNYKPSSMLIDNDDWINYDINFKFDLILHLGLLYHLQNWKKDLTMTLSHTDIIILETIVNPSRTDKVDKQYSSLPPNYSYGVIKDINMTIFTQEDVENELTSLGCKFFRFDKIELNSKGRIYKGITLENIYDWTYDKYDTGFYNSPHFVHFRRMWLVLK